MVLIQLPLSREQSSVKKKNAFLARSFQAIPCVEETNKNLPRNTFLAMVLQENALKLRYFEKLCKNAAQLWSNKEFSDVCQFYLFSFARQKLRSPRQNKRMIAGFCSRVAANGVVCGKIATDTRVSNLTKNLMLLVKKIVA